MSRWHLKCIQDGTLGDYTRVVNNGIVGGNYDSKNNLLTARVKPGVGRTPETIKAVARLHETIRQNKLKDQQDENTKS